MADLGLVNYIKKSLEAGMQLQEITATLLRAGWQQSLIDEGFMEAQGTQVPQPVPREEARVAPSSQPVGLPDTTKISLPGYAEAASSPNPETMIIKPKRPRLSAVLIMKKILRIVLIVGAAILILAFVLGWALQDYDTAECWGIYKETPQQKSLETRLLEAKKCSNFSVFLPSHLPGKTYINTGNTWWFPGGLNGEVIFSILQKMPNGTKEESVVVIVRENTLQFPFRWFSPAASFDKQLVNSVLDTGGRSDRIHDEHDIHDAKRVSLSGGRTALIWRELDSLLLYFELDSTSILLTVLGYQPVLFEAGAGKDLSGLDEYHRILADESKGGYDVKELINIAESFR